MCVSRSSKPWWLWSRLPYWVWRHLQKIAQALPYDPSVPLDGFAKSGMLSTGTMYIQSKWDIEYIWKPMQCMGNQLNDKGWWHLWWRLAKMSYQIWNTLTKFRTQKFWITSKYDTSTSAVLSSSGARYSSAMDAKPWDASRAERYSTKPPPPPHRSSTAGYGPGPKKKILWK